MNLPNRLTVARVVLIPVMVILMYLGGTACNLLAAAVFGLAAFTDFLDGHIARSRGIVTDRGVFSPFDLHRYFADGGAGEYDTVV